MHTYLYTSTYSNSKNCFIIGIYIYIYHIIYIHKGVYIYIYTPGLIYED